MTFLSSHVAALMILVGLAMFVMGIRRASVGVRRYHRDPPRALALLRGFRISIVGLCLAGVSAGWLWDIGWLVVLSLIIGGEELLESTVVIMAMTHAGDLRPRASAPMRLRLGPSRPLVP